MLESFVIKLRNQRVHWFTDNQNVVRIVLHGSGKPMLQSEALSIFAVCVAECIRFEPEWIPWESNEKADYISQLVDHDDWKLNPIIFNELDARWGPHTVDRFADMHNYQLKRFNSRFWNPGSEAMDTFTCDWGGELNWRCPPPYLVPWLIRHAQETEALGTLVVPRWYSTPYWPLLFKRVKLIFVLYQSFIITYRHNMMDNRVFYH